MATDGRGCTPDACVAPAKQLPEVGVKLEACASHLDVDLNLEKLAFAAQPTAATNIEAKAVKAERSTVIGCVFATEGCREDLVICFGVWLVDSTKDCGTVIAEIEILTAVANATALKGDEGMERPLPTKC
jgi:hypothetical protein